MPSNVKSALYVSGIAPALRGGAMSIAALCLTAACSGASAGSGPAVPKDGVVQMTVTDAGFEPNTVKIKKGVPVKLVITRKTDKTCAKEIVIDEYGINTPLPLGKAVTVAFTPTKSGELKYGCAMDKMIGGVLFVE
jgi:plastocyanin domain-containing protein